jgi:hypothetical protein
MSKPKFTLDEIMTISEAAEFYGMNVHTVKSKLKPSVVGQERIDEWVAQGLARRSGSTWILTHAFMEANFSKQVALARGDN